MPKKKVVSKVSKKSRPVKKSKIILDEWNGNPGCGKTAKVLEYAKKAGMDVEPVKYNVGLQLTCEMCPCAKECRYVGSSPATVTYPGCGYFTYSTMECKCVVQKVFPHPCSHGCRQVTIKRIASTLACRDPYKTEPVLMTWGVNYENKTFMADKAECDEQS